jgi:glycosyltransferase involved in cell wall biosynthesis
LANELSDRGHNVSIATVYSDINPEVVRYTDLPIILLNQNPALIPECDLLITNSDNPLNPNFSKLCPQVKKTIMLKLSHNPRFKSLEEMGLNLEWDAVVTSSQWLADICENPAPDWDYKPTKATRIGWYHYNFERMQRNVKRKRFIGTNGKEQIVVSTLIHAHPTKGSQDAGNIFAAIKKAHGDKVKLIGVGEVAAADLKLQIPGMEYVASPTRQEMADLMFKTDIWLGCSHGEGLGRMALEAMTGLAACVLSDTGAEFVAHDVNALVAPIGDLNGLANHVNSLILDVSRRREIAIAGYTTAKELADPTECIDTLEKVISDVFKV